MVPSVLFVHSPLVGPSTWAVAAQLMAARGFAVSVPDLTGLARGPAPMWRNLVDGAVDGAAALAGDVAIVGHSGAGALLPAIASGLQSRAVSLVFVDAVLPPHEWRPRDTDRAARAAGRPDGERPSAPLAGVVA